MKWYFHNDLEGWSTGGDGAWTNSAGKSAFGSVVKTLSGAGGETIVTRSDLSIVVTTSDIIKVWYRFTADVADGDQTSISLSTVPSLASGSENYTINTTESGWIEFSVTVSTGGTLTGVSFSDGGAGVGGSSTNPQVWVDDIFIGESEYDLRHSSGGLPGAVI